MFWQIKNKKIEYGKRTLVMGIVNVTPDSFSDGGDFFDAQEAVKQAIKLEKDGADIIDFGAQSTRPGHTEIDENEEWQRLESVLTAVKDKISVPVSVDTFYPYVAQKAIDAGADIINDISGVISLDMAKIVRDSGCGWVVMHNGNGSVNEVGEFFKSCAKTCRDLGIKKEQLCFDMGIGFGKTREQDLQLISCVSDYKADGYPLLLGTSRKRVIGEYSHQDDPKERIYGNIAADTVAILGGADIVRVHDVEKEIQGVYFADSAKKALTKQNIV